MTHSTRPDSVQPTDSCTDESSAGQNQKTQEDQSSTRIQELEAKLKEQESKYLYLYADFENFKKRALKERADLLKYGWEALARDLLQVIDNLERALAHMPASTDKTLIDGLEMVLKQFRATLESQGVRYVESVNRFFDPNFHEAIGEEHSEEHPEGKVLKEEMRGYTLHGRLLRPARVIVSKGQNTGH